MRRGRLNQLALQPIHQSAPPPWRLITRGVRSLAVQHGVHRLLETPRQLPLGLVLGQVEPVECGKGTNLMQRRALCRGVCRGVWRALRLLLAEAELVGAVWALDVVACEVAETSFGGRCVVLVSGISELVSSLSELVSSVTVLVSSIGK